MVVEDLIGCFEFMSMRCLIYTRSIAAIAPIASPFLQVSELPLRHRSCILRPKELIFRVKGITDDTLVSLQPSHIVRHIHLLYWLYLGSI